MPCGQYGSAKATAIANATPAKNVFMVVTPIYLHAYSDNSVMHSVTPITNWCYLGSFEGLLAHAALTARRSLFGNVLILSTENPNAHNLFPAPCAIRPGGLR